MMVGDTPPEQRVTHGVAGPALLRLEAVSTPDRGAAPGLKEVSLALHAGQITGLAGVSGNGQAALADLIGGLARPASGRIEIGGAAPAAWSPRAALAAGVGRIPEDRHRTGTIGDFTLTENAVLEGYAGPGIARGASWTGARPKPSHNASSPITTSAAPAPRPASGFSRAATCRN
jgi:general nucleoside transport system ATP-binding protein